MKKYNIINNVLGWLCFAVAAVTYLLTIEPTASFWDCPEFISQGFKLEVGHPPGNPIFMLTARFFITLFGGDGADAAVAVNSMSALLSAGTILLLFWTITHLVRRLIVKDDEQEISITRMIAIFGSGICGALAYTWSDTFWFSAVEGEVYAFSSFCTALVFWLILKWESRADEPHSDRWLILIAYIIGISIAVHLLNLLCVPAIGLVIYYRKFKNTTASGSLIALCVSAAVVGLILYGLVPGFVSIAQWFDRFFVNALGMSYNSGVVAYALLFVASSIWSIYELYTRRNMIATKISFILSVFLSGMLFISGSAVLLILLLIALTVYLFVFMKKDHIRILSITSISILVMFIGYSSYALLLIRSDANPPINQNSPDNVFALGSYLNREQYGQRPLLYGETFYSKPVRDEHGSVITKNEKNVWEKVVKTSPDQPDEYIKTGTTSEYKMSPELNMLFPRMYSGAHIDQYLSWINISSEDATRELQYVDDVTTRINSHGEAIQSEPSYKPTFAQNLQYFMNYQLNHMYWRYFMWNFAGRQNDIQGNGEPNHGNWISGIPFIDNARLGDQSLLPAEEGSDNKGHNVFYMLPLLMGVIGLLWQAFTSKRGIEQFWVIFFLFFMTGIAIVIYLNQTPGQPRERDYAFAGSFYAYAIWIGMGVAGIWAVITKLLKNSDKKFEKIAKTPAIAGLAAVIGIAIPLQMVSQTWDDHDRSGRYCARDYGMNYLSSVGENGIIFVNGDNDTFPLWYAQEVENYRTDVRVINLSYLSTAWYANQQRIPAYNAPAVEFQGKPEQWAYDKIQFSYFYPQGEDSINVSELLRHIYCDPIDKEIIDMPLIFNTNLYIPSQADNAVTAGIITEQERALAQDTLHLDLLSPNATINRQGINFSQLLTLDIVNQSIKNGWKRPVYFAMTVPDNYYMDFNKYMRNTGVAYQVTPLMTGSGNNIPSDTERMYKNVTEKFRWGGLDSGKDIYLDETVRRMVNTHRRSLLTLATDLYNEGMTILESDSTSTGKPDEAAANKKFEKSREILKLLEEKLPVRLTPYAIFFANDIAELSVLLGQQLNDDALIYKGIKTIEDEVMRYSKNLSYINDVYSRGMYGRLQGVDQYAPTYIQMLLSNYENNYGGNATELINKAGINPEVLAKFLYAN